MTAYVPPARTRSSLPTMPCPAGGGHGQRPGAVEGEVLLGIDRAVDVAVVDGDEAPAVGQRVLGALGERDEDLVRLEHVERGRGGAGDARVVEHDLQFGRLVRVDHEHAVVQRAGDDVGGLLRQDGGRAVDLHAVGAYGDAAAVELDAHGALLVVGGAGVAVGEHVRVGLRGEVRRGGGVRRRVCGGSGALLRGGGFRGGLGGGGFRRRARAGAARERREQQAERAEKGNPSLHGRSPPFGQSSATVVSCVEIRISRLPFRQRILSSISFSRAASRSVTW